MRHGRLSTCVGTCILVAGGCTATQVRYEPLSDPPPPLFDVEATLVGFWLPAAFAGVNVAGFHFHAITAELTRGGHVLDCQPDALDVEIDHTTALEIQLMD